MIKKRNSPKNQLNGYEIYNRSVIIGIFAMSRLFSDRSLKTLLYRLMAMELKIVAFDTLEI